MAKINGMDANKALIEKIQEKIKAAHIAATVVDKEDDKEIYKGKLYLKEEIKIIKTLDSILDILSFGNQELEENELLCYGETNATTNDITKLYMEKAKQEELFELVNSNEAKLAGIKFPSVFGEYGEIPNTNGIIRPRPKSLLETIESYETYLEEYYKKHKIEKELDEEGIRKPYPHELFTWSKGVASSPTDSNYREQTYLDYVEEAKKKKTEKKPAPAPTPTETEKKGTTSKDTEKKGEDTEKKKETLTESERIELAKERKEKRHLLKEAGAGLRIRLKEIRNFWKSKYENLKKDFETLKTGTKEEKWKTFKKLASIAAIVVAGGVLAAYVAGPLLSVIGTGALHGINGIGAAITGLIPTANGAIALSVGDRIVYGLIAAAAPAAAIYSVIRLANKAKKEEPKKGKPETEPTDEGENTEGTGETGEEKPTGKTETEEKEPVIEGNTIEEQANFINAKLQEIQKLINENEEAVNLLSQDSEDERVKLEIIKYKTEILRLQKLRKQYIKAYNKIYDEEKIEIIANASKGGATI